MNSGALEGRLTLDVQVRQVRADFRRSDPQGAALNTQPHQLRSEAEEEDFLTLHFAAQRGKQAVAARQATEDSRMWSALRAAGFSPRERSFRSAPRNRE
ncbi:MAG: hypothetical protein EDS66_01855 [Planctomycetota bacterium]|nr:MAG: hypothetical protein EDS66_01855 [Planctomycetota bacterium]